MNDANNNACADTSMLMLTVIPFPAPKVTPSNVFTSNGDKVNDVFFIETLNVSSLEVLIMNRWVEVMCEYNSFAGFWNRQVKGQDASEGVYFFKYTVKGLNGEELIGHGFFHLER